MLGDWGCIEGEREGDVRLCGVLGGWLGVLLDGERLGVVGLGACETDLEGLMDELEGDLRDVPGLEEALATGFAAAAGGFSTIGFETAGFVAGSTIGLGAACLGSDLTISLVAGAFSADFGVDTGLGSEGCGAAILGAALGAGSGAGGASLGAAFA